MKSFLFFLNFLFSYSIECVGKQFRKRAEVLSSFFPHLKTKPPAKESWFIGCYLFIAVLASAEWAEAGEESRGKEKKKETINPFHSHIFLVLFLGLRWHLQRRKSNRISEHNSFFVFSSSFGRNRISNKNHLCRLHQVFFFFFFFLKAEIQKRCTKTWKEKFSLSAKLFFASRAHVSFFFHKVTNDK